MIAPNNFVNYIWVGKDSIPDSFYKNFQSTQDNNPEFQFKIWGDEDIIQNDPEYADLFMKSSIFHKLQIGRYTIMNSHGGIYTDFDIEWKVPFKDIYNSIEGDPDMVFVYRNSLHFYDKGKKTTLVDDFFSIAKPENTKKYLKYCEKRTERRDPTEPFSVYALTEWLLNIENVKFLTHHQIDTKESSIFGVHANKKTWNTNI